MAAAVIRRDMLYVANVGDSRVYLLRNGKLAQQTIDHTLTQRKVQQGIISPDQAAMDPDRSVLTRSMGAGPSVDVDLFPPRKLQSGDIVLICSDGLTDMLDDAAIARILVTNSPQRATQRLIAEANRAGGFDNISVVVAEVGGRPKGAVGGAIAGGLGASVARLELWQKLVLGGLATGLLAVCGALGWLLAAQILFGGGDDTTPTPESPTATQGLPTATSDAISSPEASVTPRPTVTPAGQPTSTPRPTSTPTPTVDPDPDNDGFLAGNDLCPYTPGTVQGCPDADGDGVWDGVDACPDQYGDGEDGCPLPTEAAPTAAPTSDPNPPPAPTNPPPPTPVPTNPPAPGP
jgi:protein phosphatase